MTATIIDGKAVAADIESEVAALVAAAADAGWKSPRLSVVLCNDDPGSATYVRRKNQTAERVGIRGETITPPLTSSTEDLVGLVSTLGEDEDVDAILVQLPLPAQVNQDAVIQAVPPSKDVDGFHPHNFGLLAEGAPQVVPCTPAGCLELLRRCDVPIVGARAVVVGRSVIVGRPMALLLLNAHATVTVCHSRTVDLPSVCSDADILVAATGRPGMIDAEFVKPGAAVIDVGITAVDGRLRGDVERASVEPAAGWLTPVPGGVGPMTIAMLMRNTVQLAVARRPQGAPTLPWTG